MHINDDNFGLIGHFVKDGRMYAKDGEVSSHVVFEGIWKERNFMIKQNPIGVPSAYIELKPEKGETKFTIDKSLIQAHNGITHWDEMGTKTYIRWDYDGYNDYMPGFTDGKTVYPLSEGHKWTLTEVLMDIASAITDLEWA